MLYVVTYTLQPPRVNAGLTVELQSNPDWAHYLDDTWLIATAETSVQLRDRLRTHMTDQDLILIMEVKQTGQYSGYLPTDAWDWIRQRGLRWASY